MQCFRVVIADRCHLTLRGLQSIIHAENEFEVVATCRNVKTCIEAVRELSPDLAMLELSLPPTGGFRVLPSVYSACPHTRVILLSAPFDNLAGPRATTASVLFGIISKDTTPDNLLDSLRKVASGQNLGIAPPDSKRPNVYKHRFSVASADKPLLSALTARERQILDVVSEGLSNKEVGRQLNLSEGTVKVHLHNIYQKLVVRNRTALARWAATIARRSPRA